MQITTRDTIQDFQRELMSRNRSPRTIQSYTEALEQLDAHHGGGLDILEMTKRHVQGYVTHVIGAHSAITAQVRFRSLRAFYNWAVAEELIEASPMAKMKLPEVQHVPRKVAPVEDVRLVLKVCEADRTHDGRRDAAMIRLFCESGGPRLAEMAGMMIADLDRDRDQVRVAGKTGVRVFPISATTARALSRYLRIRGKHECADLPSLWLGGRGRSLTASGIAQMLRRRCDQAGVRRIHPHQLRHLAAHLHYKNGGTEQDAMRLFGWRSREMAALYAEDTGVARAIDAAAARAIGDAL